MTNVSRYLLVLAALLVGATPTIAWAQSEPLTLRVLSTRTDMVSGGDALVEIGGVAPSSTDVAVAVNGRAVTTAFSRDSDHGTLKGLVEGLRLGANNLEVRSGASRATLTITNFPAEGPIVSGPHHTPLVCRTAEVGLGDPLDGNCSASARVDYFYRSSTPTTPGEDATPVERRGFKPLPSAEARPADLSTARTSEGRTVPYIVRVESGTINRSIYRIAILDDPAATTRPWAPGPGWNGRLLYSFGGGCGTHYDQGTNPAGDALDDQALSRGFALIMSTQNVMGHRCNDALSGEALMMIKEHFIEQYGVPEWTVGRGGSGGAIQQLLIGQNFPGLLDGLLPSASFPDSFSLRTGVTDCRLLINYFRDNPDALSPDQQSAIEGYTPGTCEAWNRGLVNVIVADHVDGCGIPAELVYHPVDNPTGARCTLWDTNVASFGRDPETGFARRSLDNVGVQYGLTALNEETISTAQFLALNAQVGGYTNDGHPHSERTVADPEAVRLAYATGRVDTAAGGLGAVPILHYRAYRNLDGDIHDRFRDFSVRERLAKSTGRFDNQVIWTFPDGDPTLRRTVTDLALDTMSDWLDGIASDASGVHAIDVIVRHKPSSAVDGCWNDTGTRLNEPATFDGAGRCNELYPSHRNPRIAAGGPLADDVLKCQLKPITAADYDIALSSDDIKRLQMVFPLGVCDYTQPGMNQVPLEGTFLTLPLAGTTMATSVRR